MDKNIIEKIKSLNPELRKKLLKNVADLADILHEFTNKDQKTNTYNYTFFQNVLEIEIEQAKRKNRKISIAILDLDFFKKINDTLGHIKADKLLIRFAGVLKEQTRKSDVVARFGGEEFLILFTETSLDKALKVMNRIRNAVKKDKFLSKNSLTFSSGLTEFRKKDSSEKIKKRADIALYEAKETGRDKIVVVR